MTAFDYLVIFILVCSVVLSTFNGFVREIFSLLGWVVGFVVANAYGEKLAVLLPASLSSNTVRLIIAFLVLFIGARLAVGLLARVLSVLVKSTGLTLTDRSLGSLLGLVRGLVIVLTVALLCGMTAIPQQAFWRNAMLSPITVRTANMVLPYLPDNISKHVHF